MLIEWKVKVGYLLGALYLQISHQLTKKNGTKANHKEIFSPTEDMSE